jgi:hypothetical protein
MATAYHYQNTFNDELAQEFRQTLSLGFSPNEISGLQLWLDSSQPDAFMLDGQDHIERWTDYSGNDHHAIQTNTADRPIVSASLQNDIAGVFFDYSTNRPLLISDYIPNIEDALTIFVVARRVDVANIYDGGSVYKTLLSSGRPDGSTVETGKINISENRDNGQIYTVAHKVSAYNSPEGFMHDGKSHLITSQVNPDAAPGYAFGRADRITEEKDERDPFAAADEVLPVQIGGSANTSTRRFWGTIYEVLIYDQALDDAQIEQVERYLSAKYALNLFGELNLPEDLRIVAKGGLIPTSTQSGTYSRIETRKRATMGGQNVNSIRLVYGNSYVKSPSYSGPAVPNGGEISGLNAITIEAALELDGTVKRFTFDGADSKRLEPDEIVISDPILAFDFDLHYFSAGAQPYIRTGVMLDQIGDGWVRNDFAYIAESGDSTVASNAENSQILDIGNLQTPAGGNSGIMGLLPAAIIGEWKQEPDVSLVILGDSIITGANDDNDNGTSGGGFATNGIRDVESRSIAHIKLSRGADRADSWSLGHDLRSHLLQYATHLIENYGTNDMSAGFTAAQTLAAKQAIWNDFRESAKGAGFVISVPIAPRTSSIDNWLTLGKQTIANGFENGGTKRHALNSSVSALIGQSNGPDSIIDINLDWAGSVAADKWAVNGTTSYATSDGIHPSKALHDLAALRVTSAAASWTTD